MLSDSSAARLGATSGYPGDATRMKITSPAALFEEKRRLGCWGSEKSIDDDGPGGMGMSLRLCDINLFLYGRVDY